MSPGRGVPFAGIWSALAYYVYQNPVRLKSLDLFQIEKGSKSSDIAFSGSSREDIWASVCLSIKNVLLGHPWPFRKAFELYYLDSERRYSQEDTARLCNLPLASVKRHFKKIIEELEHDFKRRELIPNDPENSEV